MVFRPSSAAVVGVGVKAPGGCSVPELWAALTASRVVMELYDHERHPASVPVVVARVAGFDPTRYVTGRDAARMDRALLLAIGAADDALAEVVDRPPPHRCAVVCGTGFGMSASIETSARRYERQGLIGMSPFAVLNGMHNSIAAQLALRYSFEGPCQTASTACASGTDAIGQAVQLLRTGAADLVLAGGVDALLSEGTVGSFHRTGALSRSEDPASASRPFDRDRTGFVLGEGAGFLVLVRTGEVPAERVLGRIVGYAATCDASHLVAPRPDGAALATCVTAALDDAGLEPHAIGHVNAHATGTVLNDRAEALALRRSFPGGPPPVTAVKGVTGHLVGGSGAIEAILTAHALRSGRAAPTAGLRVVDPAIDLDIVVDEERPVPQTYAISTSSGFGGHNAALVVAGPEAPGS